MQKAAFLIAILGVGIVSPSRARAGVIESATTGATGSLLDGGWFGESFTTPGGGAWNNITFNFYSDLDATTPYALGTLYLFDQVFTGVPSTLSSSDVGFIANATSVVNNVWIFDPSIVLQPNTQYAVYSDTPFSAGSITGGETVDYASAYMYFVNEQDQTGYFPFTNTANFSLGGTSISDASPVVPEPGTTSMLSMGLAVVGTVSAFRNRRGQNLTRSTGA